MRKSVAHSIYHTAITLLCAYLNHQSPERSTRWPSSEGSDSAIILIAFCVRCCLRCAGPAKLHWLLSEDSRNSQSISAEQTTQSSELSRSAARTFVQLRTYVHPSSLRLDKEAESARSSANGQKYRGADRHYKDMVNRWLTIFARQSSSSGINRSL